MWGGGGKEIAWRVKFENRTFSTPPLIDVLKLMHNSIYNMLRFLEMLTILVICVVKLEQISVQTTHETTQSGLWTIVIPNFRPHEF